MIDRGDDDLIDGMNCLRIPYSHPIDFTYNSVEEEIILRINNLLGQKQEYLKKIADNCREYVVQNCDWNKIMTEINDIICKD